MVDVKFLTFKTSHTYFVVKVAIDEYCTWNKEQFGACLIKINEILSILQALKPEL